MLRALTSAPARRASSTLAPTSTASEPPLPVRPPTSSIPPPIPSSTHRLVVSSLLARSPLVLPPLHPFERAYFAYQRDIRKSLERRPDSRFFFREGSKAEESFRRKLGQGKQDVGKGTVHGVEAGSSSGRAEQAHEVGKRRTDEGGDLRSLERKRDRTLYLMVKKARKDHSWQFPQGGLEKGESLADGALRELHEELGPNLDVWSIGRVPAAHFSYPGVPKGQTDRYPDGTRVWYMPQRVLRGQARVTELGKEEGIEDFAWLTRDEIHDRVDPGLWAVLDPVLSE